MIEYYEFILWFAWDGHQCENCGPTKFLSSFFCFQFFRSATFGQFGNKGRMKLKHFRRVFFSSVWSRHFLTISMLKKRRIYRYNGKIFFDINRKSISVFIVIVQKFVKCVREMWFSFNCLRNHRHFWQSFRIHKSNEEKKKIHHHFS